MLSTGTVGVFTETVTLTPTGYNPSGYLRRAGAGNGHDHRHGGGRSAADAAERTSADAWGDVHLTTFDGLYYNFQGAGEFVLSQSTVAGDTSTIQARMQPWSTGSSVSVNTEIAAEIGTDRVTFGDRPRQLRLDRRRRRRR